MGDAVRVLIVDDEPAIRHAVEAALSDEGYEVGTAADGAAALASIDDEKPDAILLDLRMPVMDGYAFLDAYLRRPGPRAAVIVCSTGYQPSSAIQMGAAAFLRKPFDIDELIRLIDKLGAAQTPQPNARRSMQSRSHTESTQTL
jgi:two-component system chemotaxis response regulator CheY